MLFCSLAPLLRAASFVSAVLLLVYVGRFPSGKGVQPQCDRAIFPVVSSICWEDLGKIRASWESRKPAHLICIVLPNPPREAVAWVPASCARRLGRSLPASHKHASFNEGGGHFLTRKRAYLHV